MQKKWKYVHEKIIYSSLLHKSCKLETTQKPINWWIKYKYNINTVEYYPAQHSWISKALCCERYYVQKATSWIIPFIWVSKKAQLIHGDSLEGERGWVWLGRPMKEVCRVMVMFLIGVWVSTCQNSANVFLRFMYYTICKFYLRRKKLQENQTLTIYIQKYWGKNVCLQFTLKCIKKWYGLIDQQRIG